MLGKPIVIGAKYKLNIRKNEEYRCPHCNEALHEADMLFDGMIMGVVATWTGWLSHGDGCERYFPPAEGMYLMENLKQRLLVAPYTWLERIAGEDYGDP